MKYISVGWASVLGVLALAIVVRSSTSLPPAANAVSQSHSAATKGNYTVDLATVLRTQGNATCVLVDIRPAGLYQKLHIKGAVNIPAGTLAKAPEELLNQLRTASAIFLYCEDMSCASLGSPTAEFHKRNLRHAAFYAGGIREWASAGLAVESSSSSALSLNTNQL